MLLYVNPLNGALELFRQPLHSGELYWTGIFISVFSLLVLLLIGVFYFKKTETYFADLV
jgi:lipopolysaccharide transport system permease protein